MVINKHHIGLNAALASHCEDSLPLNNEALIPRNKAPPPINRAPAPIPDGETGLGPPAPDVRA